jgi:hypothetical protein
MRSEENTEGVSDNEILNILSNMVKQRRQSITQYEEGGRIELAEREREEITIIQEFLPSQLSEKEIEAEIQIVLAKYKEHNIRDIGKIMADLKKNFNGRMDFSKASYMVKALLSK